MTLQEKIKELWDKYNLVCEGKEYMYVVIDNKEPIDNFGSLLKDEYMPFSGIVRVNNDILSKLNKYKPFHKVCEQVYTYDDNVCASTLALCVAGEEFLNNESLCRGTLEECSERMKNRATALLDV